MSIKNALAGIAVRDLRAAVPWYEKLLGRRADSNPLEPVAEWRFPGGGLVQVFENGEMAGASCVTLAVTDIDDEISELRRTGTQICAKSVSTNVRTATVEDPDGNQIVFSERRAAWAG